MLVIVAHPQSLTDEELIKLKDDLKDYFVSGDGKGCNVTSLYFQKFIEKLVGVPLPEMEHLYGKTHLEEHMLDLVFHLSPTSYFQVNTKGAEVLYSAIMELVQPNENTTVLDLCCGTGGIGLCIAKKCGQVFGIEYLSQNIEDAKFNAERNEITNCEFIAGKVEDILPTLSSKMTGKSVVPILDPPRAGLNQKVLAQLRRLDTVKKLVYVCSNHKAPIRNFLDLCCPAGRHAMSGHPFVPVRTVPVDVVPHTAHAQMVVLLERVDPATLPKATSPPSVTATASSGRKVIRGSGRGGKGALLGRGGPRGRGRGLPPPLARGRGRGGGLPLLRGPPMPPPPPHRLGYGAPPPLPREPPLPPRPRIPRGDFDHYGPPPYGPTRRPRLDFASDELTLSRYSDFRRDVEDAIDSSLGPRPLLPAPSRRLPRSEMDMLEREEMAYRAGLTRGMAAGFGPPSRAAYGAPPFGHLATSSGGGRFKNAAKRGRGTGRGVARGGRGRRGQGHR